MQTTLVVIDLQNYYINENTKDLPEKIVSHIENTHYDHVLFTKFINTDDSSLSKFLNWRKMQLPPDTDLYNGVIKFVTSERVFIKNTYSIFKVKSFIDYINLHKISDVYLCGLDTDACILASQYDGFDLGYRVKVLVDLCRCHSGEKFHNSALSIIEKNLQ